MPFDPKKLASNLADMAGVSLDSATNTPVSWSSQTDPNSSLLLANPLSPVQGDETFYTFLIPGSVFQAHDGSQWLVLEYEWDARVYIENRWYPAISANVSVEDVRRSIDAWVDPVYVKVPPPIPGIKYTH
jgi:hypothetical protein